MCISPMSPKSLRMTALRDVDSGRVLVRLGTPSECHVAFPGMLASACMLSDILMGIIPSLCGFAKSFPQEQVLFSGLRDLTQFMCYVIPSKLYDEAHGIIIPYLAY